MQAFSQITRKNFGYLKDKFEGAQSPHGIVNLSLLKWKIWIFIVKHILSEETKSKYNQLLHQASETWMASSLMSWRGIRVYIILCLHTSAFEIHKYIKTNKIKVNDKFISNPIIHHQFLSICWWFHNAQDHNAFPNNQYNQEHN